jgi:hypothetical protein
LSRISLKRASSDDDTDDNTKKARTDDQADGDEDIDDAMPSAEADDDETTIKVNGLRLDAVVAERRTNLDLPFLGPQAAGRTPRDRECAAEAGAPFPVRRSADRRSLSSV